MTKPTAEAAAALARLREPYDPTGPQLVADALLVDALAAEVIVRGKVETAALLRGVADGLDGGNG